jgi:pimeloyl-ACP methyl ester carboxylesterase
LPTADPVRKSLIMQATSNDGGRIDFETVGHGHPLVLLHGFFGDRTSWRSAGYVDALAAKFSLILIDARGHGGSDAPHDTDSYRIDRQVHDVLTVLDALGIDQAALWGASMGGTIGLHLLARHPQRLTALITGGAHAERIPADPAEVQREAELFRTEGTAPFITWLERQGPLPSWLRNVMRSADAHALAALNTALACPDNILGTLAQASVPVLLLAGDRDPRLAAIRRTAAQIPSATLIELPDCGHLDTFVRNDLTLPLVLPFLSNHTVDL